MSNKQITDYTAATTIDATNDYLLEYQNSSGVYKKINRNTLLGITGSPIGTTDSQTLSNKTVGNTNSVTLKDTSFTLQDDADTTKQAQFQLSGITTGTTRTYTLPNATDTLAGIATTQTLTNKTLTSPTITGGSISNTTITTDSIAGFSSSTNGSIFGISVTSGTIPTAGIADGAVTPAKLTTGTGSSWTWQSWTPTWTNLIVSSSTVVAKYTQVGKIVFFRVNVTLGGGNAPTGNVSFTAPVTAVTGILGVDNYYPCGQINYGDAGVNSYAGWIRLTSTTSIQLLVGASAGTYPPPAAVSATIPFAWGNGDGFSLNGFYEAA